MTCFITHFPLSVVSIMTFLLVLATMTFIQVMMARRPRLYTVNLTTAPARVRQNLRAIR